MLGARFDKALQLAADLHREQTRKGAPVPYLSHLMAVAGLVLEANGHCRFDNVEDLAIAALLHDALEDQGHRIATDFIRSEFGGTVARIVEQCSDDVITQTGQTKSPWKQRKQTYLEGLAGKPKDTQLVSVADKLHNARSMLFDHGKIGDDLWQRFTGGRDGTLWYYRRLAEEFEQGWPENPLISEFRAAVRRLETAASR